MNERRNFLRNRGGLLKKPNNNPTPPTQTPLGQNPFANPFHQPQTPQPNQIPQNLNQVKKLPNQNTSALTQAQNHLNSQSGNNVHFSYTEADLQELNSSPETVRFTSSRFPPLNMAGSVRMPIGCHVRPWFNTKESISMVDFFQLYREKTGEEPQKKFDIPRCSGCRSYVNPFFEFSSHGRQMQCNLCLLVQSVPAYYVAPLNEEGKRVDLHER